MSKRKQDKSAPATIDAPQWSNVTVRLSQLKAWPRNPRLSTKKQAKGLLDSFARFGQVQTIAIGPDFGVYDGHQRLSALLTVYGADYEVAARQCDRLLTEKEREQLVVTLHAGAVGSWDWNAISGWDTSELQNWGMGEDALASWGNDYSNLKEMLAAQHVEADAEPQIDKADELREKWGTSLGDLWQLGEHRLICGDCTDGAVVARVMQGEKAKLVVTDPPYGVEYADKNRFLNSVWLANRIEKPIDNDHETKEVTQAMWKSAFCEMAKVMDAGAVVYCFMPQGGDQMMMMMMMMMMGAGIEPRHELIWLKNNHVLGRVDYAYKHEPILYAWKAGGHKFYGDFQTSVIECNKPNKSDLHPTTKPLELITRLVANSSETGNIVYDGFLGSGTTLLACQNLGRRARCVEIDPAYVAVTLQRFQDAIGLTPQRVTAGTT